MKLATTCLHNVKHYQYCIHPLLNGEYVDHHILCALYITLLLHFMWQYFNIYHKCIFLKNPSQVLCKASSKKGWNITLTFSPYATGLRSQIYWLWWSSQKHNLSVQTEWKIATKTENTTRTEKSRWWKRKREW